MGGAGGTARTPQRWDARFERNCDLRRRLVQPRVRHRHARLAPRRQRVPRRDVRRAKVGERVRGRCGSAVRVKAPLQAAASPAKPSASGSPPPPPPPSSPASSWTSLKTLCGTSIPVLVRYYRYIMELIRSLKKR